MSGSKKLPEITQQVRVQGASNLFDDSVTVQIGLREENEAPPAAKGKTSNAKALTGGIVNHFETNGDIASLVLEAPDDGSPESADRPRLEVKITINMKQIEKHSRDVDKYVSPFPIPNTIYARIPLLPADHDRIEVARDRLEHLVGVCKTTKRRFLTESDVKGLLSRLRQVDVRCSALYPRLPPPGSKDKRINRICPQFPLEIEDIESELDLIGKTIETTACFPTEELYRKHVSGLEKEKEFDRQNRMRKPEDRIPPPRVVEEDEDQQELYAMNERRMRYYRKRMLRAMRKHQMCECTCSHREKSSGRPIFGPQEKEASSSSSNN